jgi:hypothetical protein
MNITHKSDEKSETTINHNSEISLSRNIIKKASKLTEKLQKSMEHFSKMLIITKKEAMK